MAQPNDVKQILELGGGINPLEAAQRRKELKLKDKRKRPENVNREVFALMGDVPQLAPADTNAQNISKLVKKERNFKKAVDKWVWHGFDNPARSDHLVLHHWTKVKETEEPYPFSRFNRKIEVIRYTDEEYTIVNEKLKSQAGGLAIVTDWSKEETDHLFDLCEQFSLRFIVIADRFGLSTFTPYPGPSDSPLKKREAKAAEKEEKKYAPKFHERTVDEIKDRYYSVARAVLELRGQSDHPLLKKPPFSYEQEVKRKCNNEKLFMRTKEQHEKEKTFVAELKKLESRIKKEEKEERNFRKLVYSDTAFTVPPAQENGSLQAAGQEDEDDLARGGGRRDRGSGVFLRSQVLTAPLPTKKEALQQKFEIVLSDIGVNPVELQPTKRVAEVYQELTSEILKLFALENYVKKAKEDQNVINEAKQEKRTYFEAAKKQFINFQEQAKQQFLGGSQQQQIQMAQQQSQQQPQVNATGQMNSAGMGNQPGMQVMGPPQNQMSTPAAQAQMGQEGSTAVSIQNPTIAGAQGTRKRQAAQQASAVPQQQQLPGQPSQQMPPQQQRGPQPGQAPSQQPIGKVVQPASTIVSTPLPIPQDKPPLEKRRGAKAQAAAQAAAEQQQQADEEKKSPSKVHSASAAQDHHHEESHDSSVAAGNAQPSEGGAATGKRPKKPRATAQTVPPSPVPPVPAAGGGPVAGTGKASKKQSVEKAAAGAHQIPEAVAETPAVSRSNTGRKQAAVSAATSNAGSANVSAAGKKKQ